MKKKRYKYNSDKCFMMKKMIKLYKKMKTEKNKTSNKKDKDNCTKTTKFIVTNYKWIIFV